MAKLKLIVLLAGVLSAPFAFGQGAQFNDLFERQAEAEDLSTRTHKDPLEPEFDLSQAGDNNYQVGTDELEDYLDARLDIRDEPYIVTNGQAIVGRYSKAEPIVAGPDMCDDQDAIATILSHPQTSPFSPRAVYQGPAHGLDVQADGTLTLTEGGTETGTLSIDPPLNVALPQGFVLAFSDNTEYAELTAAASVGATSLALRVTNLPSGTQSVTIANNELGVSAARYTSQGAINNVEWRDLTIVGRPTTLMDETSSLNLGQDFGCDGLVFPGTGCKAFNVDIGMLPGVCFWIPRYGNTFTRKGRHTPFEAEKALVQNCRAWQSHMGFVFDAVDTECRGVNEAHDLTYFGAWFRTNSLTNVDAMHMHGAKGATTGGGYGFNATAIMVQGIVRANYLEGETSTAGVDFRSGAAYSQVSKGRSYNNDVTCWRVFDPNCYFGFLRLTNGDSYTVSNTGTTNQACLDLGDYADNTVIDAVRLESSNSSRGITVGDNASRAIQNVTIVEGMVTGSGDKGVYFLCDQANCTWKFTFDSTGYTKEVFFDSGFTAKDTHFVFRGPGACTIEWPDGTDGTFTDPNMDEAGVTLDTVGGNTFEFIVTDD